MRMIEAAIESKQRLGAAMAPQSNNENNDNSYHPSENENSNSNNNENVNSNNERHENNNEYGYAPNAGANDPGAISSNNDNNDDTIQCFDNYSAKQWIAYLTTKYKMSSAISRQNPLSISKNDKIAFKKIFKALFDKADFETQLLLKLWKNIIETGIPGTTDPHAQEQSRY
jgi:hypothetical protein